MFNYKSRLNFDLISLSEASSLCNYSSDYLRLRARQGKLQAVKHDGIWYTKKNWLDNYCRFNAESVRGLEKSGWENCSSIKSFVALLGGIEGFNYIQRLDIIFRLIVANFIYHLSLSWGRVVFFLKLKSVEYQSAYCFNQRRPLSLNVITRIKLAGVSCFALLTVFLAGSALTTPWLPSGINKVDEVVYAWHNVFLSTATKYYRQIETPMSRNSHFLGKNIANNFFPAKNILVHNVDKIFVAVINFNNEAKQSWSEIFKSAGQSLSRINFKNSIWWRASQPIRLTLGKYSGQVGGFLARPQFSVVYWQRSYEKAVARIMGLDKNKLAEPMERRANNKIVDVEPVGRVLGVNDFRGGFPKVAERSPDERALRIKHFTPNLVLGF